MSWIVLILAAGLMWLISKSGWLMKQKWIFVPQALLAFTVGAALSEIEPGRWIGGIFGWVTGLFDRWMPAALLAAVLVVLGFVAAVFKLLDKDADKTELALLVLLPSLAIAASGMGVATLIVELAGTVSGAATSATSSVIGGGG